MKFAVTTWNEEEVLAVWNDDGIHLVWILSNEHENAILNQFFPSTTMGKVEFPEFILNALNGDRSNIRLAFSGTDFQKKVWNRLLEIPSGETITYGQISEEFGMKAGSRAIGTAVGANRHAILVPCHRVVPANGKMGGFRWGIPTKLKLLRLEQRDIGLFNQL